MSNAAAEDDAAADDDDDDDNILKLLLLFKKNSQLLWSKMNRNHDEVQWIQWPEMKDAKWAFRVHKFFANVICAQGMFSFRNLCFGGHMFHTVWW